MAMTIKQLLSFSWMSQASYLDFTGLATNASADALGIKLQGMIINPDKIFSPTQATAFTDPTNGYSFISYAPNDLTGFSATVFKANGATNDYTIAVRGTEPSFLQNLIGAVADLWNADVIGVVLEGAAYAQTISAYCNYKQMTTANGHQVSYSAAELAKLGAMYNETLLSLPFPILDAAVRTVRVSLFLTSLTDISDPYNWGTGAIDATTANIHFTGHSLGGHVATMLASMVQQFGQGNVADVMTYNAPGQGGLLGVSTLIDATAIASKITNIIGEGGMTVTPNVGSLSGYFDQVFIETDSVNQINNHSIVKLSDSLALYNLFAQLDPTLNTATNGLQTITGILKASSNIAANSLESAVNALGKLFNVTGTTFTANEFDGNRDLLYKALNDINTAIGTNTFTLRDLSAFNATQIASIAQNNLAYRYALVNGNPFALVGDDTIYSGAGELNLFNTADHTGSLTSQYLTDRAAWLTAKMSSNVSDKTVDVFGTTAGWAKQGGEEIYYESTDAADVAASLYQGDRTTNFFGMGDTTITPVSYMKQIKFGADQGDTLTGDNKDDRLYGMGGDDILTGGKGNDTLEGGQGNDAYVWNTGDGFDAIRDTDGLGSIKMNGQTLTAGETRDGGRTYTSTDAAGNSHTYAVLAGDVNAAGGATLLIDGTIEVFNYRAGDLGLTLGDVVLFVREKSEAANDEYLRDVERKVA